MNYLLIREDNYLEAWLTRSRNGLFKSCLHMWIRLTFFKLLSLFSLNMRGAFKAIFLKGD